MRYAAIIFGLFLAVPAVAQTAPPSTAAKPASGTNSVQQNLGLGKHDSSAPIHLSADTFSSDVKTKEGDYAGNVVVTQGDMTMRADKMHFDVTDGDLSMITATSNVVVVAPNGTATGDHGIYDLKTHLITMTGKVVLTKKKDVMRGTKLVMDMTTNLAHLTADSTQGNRVTAIFLPKQQAKNDGTGGATPQKPSSATGK